MAKKTLSKQKKPRGKDWDFPRNSLEEAIKVVQVLEDKFAGKPTPIDLVMKPLGFNNRRDWRLSSLLISAEQYGLTERGEDLKPTPLGQQIVAPNSPKERQVALKKAFEAVSTFKSVSENYSGKKIPEDEYFNNTVIRQFGVDRDRVDTFSEIFRKNLEYLSAFGAVDLVDSARQESGDSKGDKPSKDLPQTPGSSLVAGTRSFLNTCFVLMPFGQWFDAYYDEVYSPAIRDAGFDPIRADGIFATNSVIEQIWDQIKRASVLVAELTEKNPNVFYELGLAHAVGKPVILIAQALEDVPFDLRHVRIITYDVRNPKWAKILEAELTKYLHAIKENPAAAIPRMFTSSTVAEND